MSHDLPSISLNTAKVIKIICYDLPYVKDNGPLCFAHPKDVKIYLEFLDHFCVNSVLTLKTDKFKFHRQPKSNSSFCGYSV